MVHLEGVSTMTEPTTEAVMRARAVLGNEVKRLRDKAALWRAQGGFHADLLDADADELESVRRYLLPLDYPSIQEAARKQPVAGAVERDPTQ
jgi:hypothetical protein